MRWRHDSNGYPIFETMPDTSLTLPTLSDVGCLPKFKMAATKPEVEIAFERREMEPRFQLLPPYYRSCRLGYDTVDIVRRRPTTKFKMASMETGSDGRHLDFPVTSQRRAMSAVSQTCPAWSQMWG